MSLANSGIFCADSDEQFCLGRVPKELLQCIFCFLQLRDACSAFRACKTFWRLSQLDSVWRAVYRNTFGTCLVREEFVTQFREHLCEQRERTEKVPVSVQTQQPPRQRREAGENADEEDVDEEEEDDSADGAQFELVQRYVATPLGLLPWRWMARAHTLSADKLVYGLGKINSNPAEPNSYFFGLFEDGDIALGVCAVKGEFIYGGEFRKRRGHGLGVTVFNTGGYYIGEFSNGELDGEGTLHYKEGDEYSGEWKSNAKHGFGIYKWASGNVYIGQWIDNRREGVLGELIWINGDIYIGHWLDNKRTGLGVLKWCMSRGGGFYVGEFLDNQLHGFGNFSFRNIKFEGTWLNDKREGKGVLRWLDDGDWYEGEWKTGARCGKGLLHLSNGEVIEQEWNEPPDIKYSQCTPLKFVPKKTDRYQDFQ